MTWLDKFDSLQGHLSEARIRRRYQARYRGLGVLADLICSSSSRLGPLPKGQ